MRWLMIIIFGRICCIVLILWRLNYCFCGNGKMIFCYWWSIFWKIMFVNIKKMVWKWLFWFIFYFVFIVGLVIFVNCVMLWNVLLFWLMVISLLFLILFCRFCWVRIRKVSCILLIWSNWNVGLYKKFLFGMVVILVK